MKSKFPFFSRNPSGTFARLITATSRGKTRYLTLKHKPSGLPTSLQKVVRQNFYDAKTAWLALSDFEKMLYNKRAKDLPLTGYNLFIKEFENDMLKRVQKYITVDELHSIQSNPIKILPNVPSGFVAFPTAICFQTDKNFTPLGDLVDISLFLFNDVGNYQSSVFPSDFLGSGADIFYTKQLGEISYGADVISGFDGNAIEISAGNNFSGGGAGGFKDPVIVQKKTYGATAKASSHEITLDSLPTIDNTLIICITSDTTVITPTGFDLVASGVDYNGTYIFSKTVESGDTATITIDLNTSDVCSVAVYEYSGLLSAGQIDKSASATGQGPTVINTGTTDTTTQDKELAIAIFGMSIGYTDHEVSSVDNGFTIEDQIASTSVDHGDTSHSDVRLCVATKTLTEIGDITDTGTLNTSGVTGDVGAIATFKCAPVPPSNDGVFCTLFYYLCPIE